MANYFPLIVNAVTDRIEELPLGDGLDLSSSNISNVSIITAVGNITTTGNVTGNFILGNGSQLTGIDATSIQFGTSNVRVVSSGGNVAIGIGGTGNIVVVASTGEYVTGVLSVTGNANVGNLGATNIVGTLTTASQTNITSVGTLGSLSVTGNVSGGNLTTAGQVSATGNVSGGNLTTAGQVSATGNVSGGNLNVTGNIVDTGALSLVTAASGNVNLAPNGTNVLIATTTGANITGTLNATGNANVGNLGAATVVATTLTGTLSTAAQTNITSVGTLTALTVTGNVSGGNLTTAGQVSATGNVSGGNLNVTGNIVDTGALSLVTAASGNVSLAPNGTNVLVATTTGANITGTLNATGNANVGNLGAATVTATTLTGTLSTASQTNITSVGTLGSLSVTGNITGGNLLINTNAVITGNLTVNGTETIFNVANLTVNDKDIIVANNVTGGANVNGAGLQAGNPATATWFFNNATTSWQSNVGITPTSNGTLALGGTTNYWGAAYVTTLTATGNANVGNLGTSGNISASYFLGNGSQLTGISPTAIANGNSNVAINLAAGNVTVGINGQANTAIISTGAIFVNGVFSSAKTVSANIQIPANTNSMIVGSQIIETGYTMTVPDSSTVYVLG